MKILKGLILLSFLLVIIWLQNFHFSTGKPEQSLKNLSYDELKTYFTNLSKKEGAKAAFEVLKTANLPPNTDLHLLGHIVGEVLYQQQGANGIQICTQDFRNACSHSIVVGLFTDKGEDALNEIKEACKKAPGGLGAYTMCYHGLGHGILAYEGYELPKTIELCKKTGTAEHENKEYPECVSGAVMEIISGGGHDQQLWAAQRPKYLKANNPFYICSSDLMPKEARGRCYDYITPYLWEAVGGDINNPTKEDFQKSFKLCNQIAEVDYKNICFGGFGKEFVGLAQSRDIRNVDQMDNNKLRKIADWCKLAEQNGGMRECLLHALSSIFWGGENDYHAAIRFCNVIDDSENNNACFLNLIEQVSYYIKDAKIKESFCKQIPSSFSDECNRRLYVDSCSNLTLLANKKQCWEEKIENVLKDDGVDAAFDLVDLLYKNNPQFASDCHSYIHLVGQTGYQLFSQNRQIKLSAKASTCGYGFYHGFMETLLIVGKDIKEAGRFCEWAKKQVGGTNDVEGACFHGIGHGLTEDHDKKSWLSENELVDKALGICEEVTRDEYMINRCASGVFNVLAIKYNSAALPLNKQDPLGFCKTQTKPYFKKPCFEEMNTTLISISRSDIIAAAKYLDEIEDQYALFAMRSLAGVVGMSFKDNSYDLQIQNCRKLPSRLRLSCIRGFVGGLIEGQTPNTQEIKALAFCSSVHLQDNEKTNCYQEALRLLSLYLPLERYQDICGKLDKRYKNYCDT